MESSFNVTSQSNIFRQTLLVVTFITLLFTASSVFSQEFYFSGSVGLNDPSDSSSSGRFVSDFVSGQVSGFDSPVTFASGAPFGWETDFSDGETYSFAVGYKFSSFRIELAHQSSSSNVSSQSDVNFAGTDVTSLDAGFLITGNTNDFGINVGQYLSSGGRMDTTTVMLNGYYDFDFGGDLNPYVGVGIGNAEEDVVFSTVDGNLLRDKENGFAWQLIGGLEYQATPRVSVFGQYRYFQADDPSFGLKLLPGSVDVENQFQAFEIGLRFSF